MTERPRLTIVDETFAAMPAPKDAVEKQRRAGEQSIVAKHVPALQKRWEAQALRSFNVKSFAELHELNALRKELKERPTLAEIAHARHASRGYSALMGAIIGAAAATIVILVALANYAPILNSIVHESTLTGAVVQQLNPPRPCTPGERLQDGRVCPQAQQ